MGACVLSFAAGVLTILSPCVLPLVPATMASALQRHPFGPLALVAGFAGSSAALGILFAMLAFAVDADVVRRGASAVLILTGVVLVSVRLQRGIARLTAPIGRRASDVLLRVTPEGWPGQLLVGTLLGAIWSPCAGPTVTAAIGLAAQRTSVVSAIAVLGAFSAGAAMPLVLLAYGSRQVVGRRAEGINRIARPVMAAAFLIVGIFTVSGVDRRIEARLIDFMPAWLTDLATWF